MYQDPEVLARRRLAHPQLPGDEHATDPVTHEIAINLRGEVRLGILEPLQDLKPLFTGERFDCDCGGHATIILW